MIIKYNSPHMSLCTLYKRSVRISRWDLKRMQIMLLSLRCSAACQNTGKTPT